MKTVAVFLIGFVFLGCSSLKVPLERTLQIPKSFEEIDLSKEDIKTINVIFHVFNDSLGQGNFKDTLPHRKWLSDQIKGANYFLKNIHRPIPKVGTYYKDAKIRLQLMDIKYWYSNKAASAKVHGKYSHKDLYKDYVKNNPNLSDFERDNCVHLLLSGVRPRAYGGRNICLKRGCSDGFGFENNVLYFEGMYQVYTREFEIWNIGGHIMHEMGHGLGLGHYGHGLGPCSSCEGLKPCPPEDCNNFMKANNGGKGVTECQLKEMHFLLKYGPIDSSMINPNGKAHLLIKQPIPQNRVE